MRRRAGSPAPRSYDPDRRALLALLGSTAPLWARGTPLSAGPRRPQTPAPACILRPEQTEGPYFVDERLNRSDLRSNPSDGRRCDGIPLRLDLHVGKVVGAACTPLSGAVVDLWHCDALGIYSDVLDDDGRFDTRGKAFLRGFQTTDAKGNVTFLTIFPGWYEGRAVHLHFKIRTHPRSAKGFEFTSQIYFEDALTDVIHAQQPYASKGVRDARNGDDGLYRRGGQDLILPLAKEGEGYSGRFELGLKMG